MLFSRRGWFRLLAPVIVLFAGGATLLILFARDRAGGVVPTPPSSRPIEVVDRPIVAGRARWLDGRPVEDAWLLLYRPDSGPGGEPGLEARTGPDGRFRFEDVPPGERELIAYVWSVGAHTRRVVAMGGPERVHSYTGDVHLVVRRVLPTRGRVLEERDWPAGDVIVRATEHGREIRVPQSGYDGGKYDGTFEVGALEGTSVDLEVFRWRGDHLVETRGPVARVEGVVAGSADVVIRIPAGR